MSNFVIKVSTEQMQQASDTVDSKLSTMKNAFEALDNTVDSTKSYWQGEGAEHYRSAYKQSRSSIEEVLARLKEEVTDLRKMAGIYTAAENTNKAQAAALPSDVIS